MVEPLVSGDHYYAEVAAVEPAGVQTVYSLRVDSADHAFLTDGFVSHKRRRASRSIAREMLRDLDADTVNFQPNYDGQNNEPDGPARALPEPAGQRLERHRGRHGHEHPAAQPARDDRCDRRLHRQPGRSTSPA